jgi:hypothetical protein
MQSRELCLVAGEDGRLAPATLVNLSGEGFCLETGRVFHPGERIELRVLGLGHFAGVVGWTKSGRAGGTIEPLS